MWPFKSDQNEFSEFHTELLLLCEEWFQGQIRDLPEDELPPSAEIEADIVRMRTRTSARILSAVTLSRFLDAAGRPDDGRNRDALRSLMSAYQGHEATTGIFVTLALAKAAEPRYQSGWPLVTIRAIAETWLEQSTS